MTSTRHEAFIRCARLDEVEALTELIMRSKSYWGYDRPFLEAYRAHLLLSPEALKHDPVYCAEVGEAIAGVSHLIVVSDEEICLSHLFVEPAFIGQGISALLWRHAVDQARRWGAKALVFGADPHARTFYEGMGAVVVGENLSRILPGRRIPRMRYEV
jgi:GNAT superfamily N-acetyltransferase